MRKESHAGRRASACIAGALMVLVAACGDGPPEPAPRSEHDARSCATAISFRGETFGVVAVSRSPRMGARIGAGVLLACGDPDGADAERVPVARLEGASPSRALVWEGHPDVVLVSETAGRTPRAVERLFSVPGCVASDSPILLRGAFAGILDPEGDTEADLIPPYDVEMLVEDASAKRYEGAFLVVRVPSALGRSPASGPLSRQALATLQAGGRVEAEATCRAEGFEARRIRTVSP